jgi:DNA-binding NtrC family response regulator
VNRLNVLLTDDEVHPQPWAVHLPRLLEPQGVRAIRVGTVQEALGVIEREPIHAAVVAMSPPPPTTAETLPGGLKLLRVIQRITPTPPAVVVRDRAFDRRVDDRLLSEALKLSVFTVLDQPVGLEDMLETLRRLLQRHYSGMWPTG